MRITPFTPNREFISDQLTRAKRFHCPISLVYELDVTETLAALDRTRAEGASASLTALLVKATGVLLERHPRLNRHLFHRWFRRLDVSFDEVSCTLVVRREGPAGEAVLFPVLIREPQRLSVSEIHRQIRYHKEEDLARLPQMAAFRRIQRMSWLARQYFSYKARSDPRFYVKYYGTYGVSSNVARDFGPVAGGGAVANTGVAFLPGVIRDLPRVVEGEVRVRKVLSLAVMADHFLIDGADLARAMVDLRELLETPRLLEPA
jgi:pyruvate/2-oxoglutarate dehydrogenase complex dihydrolipoamide acyltransferase (E2) component